MTTLFQAFNATSARTENGMPVFTSSLDANVDFFSKVGAMRGKDATGLFTKALAQDTEVAIRALQWLRDVRGGAGERAQYRNLVKHLLKNPKYDAICEALLHKTTEIGRWDDLHVFMGTKHQDTMIQVLSDALFADGSALAAKWTPRKGEVFNALRKYHKMTPKGLRKFLVGLSNTVEQKMCAGDWESIAFEHVPSVAAGRYQRAFSRNAELKYSNYRDALAKGEAKINAGAVYPYNVLQSMRSGDAQVSDAQWKALPNYLEGSDENILPLVDVSGSMYVSAGGNPNVTCLDVAISLGLYLSERSEGVFKDTFLTFSNNSTLCRVNGSLSDRYRQMARADWGMSTDFVNAFTSILNAATAGNVPQEQMPSTVLVLSDMQFNASQAGSSWSHQAGNAWNEGAQAAVRAKYLQAGYKMPKLVFWDLNARQGQSHATANQPNVAMISGFSPALMTSVLQGKDFTPKGIMLETLMKERYDL